MWTIATYVAWHFSNFKFEYLRENEFLRKGILACLSGAQMSSIHEKNRDLKSRDTASLGDASNKCHKIFHSCFIWSKTPIWAPLLNKQKRFREIFHFWKDIPKICFSAMLTHFVSS